MIQASCIFLKKDCYAGNIIFVVGDDAGRCSHVAVLPGPDVAP